MDIGKLLEATVRASSLRDYIWTQNNLNIVSTKSQQHVTKTHFTHNPAVGNVLQRYLPFPSPFQSRVHMCQHLRSKHNKLKMLESVQFNHYQTNVPYLATPLSYVSCTGPRRPLVRLSQHAACCQTQAERGIELRVLKPFHRIASTVYLQGSQCYQLRI
jgi:hypothetical protein